MIGRWSQLTGQPEVSKLEPGMDFRLPQYRREVFLRFYEFHSRYKAHPGCVYYLIPWLARRYEMDLEEKLWFCYINGNTQNPVTSWLIWTRWPRPGMYEQREFEAWFNTNWPNLQFDTDRRWQKKGLPDNLAWYVDQAGHNQRWYFNNVTEKYDREDHRFQALWHKVYKEFPTFGRLAAFSYLEYLRIAGAKFDCDTLFLEDMDGSRSHRNGLAIVLGRDDLDFKDTKPQYTPEQLGWLNDEAALLLQEARERIPDASYFTLESALCTYKSWHRPNRRYPNVYNDMLHDRIKWAQERWFNERELGVFWEARRDCLPPYLRLEDNLDWDVGCKPKKQNWYRETGQVVMMDQDWAEFTNEYSRPYAFA